MLIAILLSQVRPTRFCCYPHGFLLVKLNPRVKRVSGANYAMTASVVPNEITAATQMTMESPTHTLD